MARTDKKNSSTTTNTTQVYQGGSTADGVTEGGPGQGDNGASGLSEYTEVDVTEIFGAIHTKDGQPHRISISGADLNTLMANPDRKLYVGRMAAGAFIFSLAPVPGKIVREATPAIAAVFGKNAAGRREGLLRLQYYMEMSGAYTEAGAGPTLGTWSDNDYQALTNVLANLDMANSRTQGGKGFTKPHITLGKFLKDQTEKAIALAQDAAKRSASSGGGSTISVTDTLAGESALDQQFRQLTGRIATKAEKDAFTSAFRADEIAAQKSSSKYAPSPEQQQVNMLTALTGQYEQSVVDPLIKYEHKFVRASDVPVAGRAAVAAKYGVDYAAISKFYASNPTLSFSSGGGGIVEEPDLDARAEATAKASADYMPYQIGSRGQDFLQMLRNPTYTTNPDIRSG